LGLSVINISKKGTPRHAKGCLLSETRIEYWCFFKKGWPGWGPVSSAAQRARGWPRSSGGAALLIACTCVALHQSAPRSSSTWVRTSSSLIILKAR